MGVQPMFTVSFVWEHRYQGVAIAEVEGIAYVELAGDDWYFDRITFTDLTRQHEVDVLPADRKAIEHFLSTDHGYRLDIEDAAHDARMGRFSRDREVAYEFRQAAE